MAISTRNEAKKINSAINVTPMVDVMLVLLIIFMVITPMLPNSRVKMATTANPIDMPDANKADALVVAVMHDGRLFLGSESVTAELLTERVRERLSARGNQTVYVRADARARYKFVVAAVDDVRSAGADRLGLLTEQRLAPRPR